MSVSRNHKSVEQKFAVTTERLTLQIMEHRRSAADSACDGMLPPSFARITGTYAREVETDCQGRYRLDAHHTAAAKAIG